MRENKLYISATDLQDEVFIPCECGNVEHSLQITYYDDGINDGDWTDEYPPLPDLDFNLQLSPYLGFWKRLYYGIKYIVGIHSANKAHWNTCMVDEDGAKVIIEYCNKYLTDMEKAKEINNSKRKVY